MIPVRKPGEGQIIYARRLAAHGCGWDDLRIAAQLTEETAKMIVSQYAEHQAAMKKAMAK